MCVWDWEVGVQTMAPTFVLSGHTSWVLSVRRLASAPGVPQEPTHVATTSFDGTLRLWHIPTGAVLASSSTQDRGGALCSCIMPFSQLVRATVQQAT